MIVRDKSSELGVFLKDSYQETIAKIEEDSYHQEALAIKESTDAAQIKADSIKNEAKRQATSYDLMQLSSGRLEAQRLKQEAQIELLNEVKTKLIDIANNMSPNQKQTFCKALNQNITKKIQEHGFKKQDFSFFCPKDIKLANCKSELTDLAIEARSETVVFKVGLTELIQAKQDDIKKHVLRYIEDNIEE